MPVSRRPSPILAIVGASSGNLVEWYDFYTYSFTALYFGPVFFPEGDSTSQLLKTAGIFAVGFLMRPIGGWFFGRMADKQGRRASMIASVLLMSAGSLMISLLPGYASIGVWAPFLLLLARMIQGLSVGGEYGASATYMSEVASSGRRGFYSSFQYVTLIGGQLLSLLVLLLLQNALTLEQLKLWGWRIPFVIGALAAVVALFLRRTLEETTTQSDREHSQAGTLSALRRHKRACCTVFGFTAGGSLMFYTFTTYMQKYLVNSAGFEVTVASRVMTGVLLVYMLLQPALGALSDRIGRRNCMIASSLCGTLTTVPLLYAIGQVADPYSAFGLILLALTGISFYTSISGIVKAEMFPVKVRALGVGFCYALSNAIFGGSAEYMALWLKSRGHESWFFYYVAAMSALVLAIALSMPDSRKTSFFHAHNEPGNEPPARPQSGLYS